MSKFINEISIEADDESDDFFQSKHIIKRKEDFEKMMQEKGDEVFSKLISGLKRIKGAYRNEDWKYDKEKLFLEIFSKLHVVDKVYEILHKRGYYLLGFDSEKRCFYDLENDRFIVDYNSIWHIFHKRLSMRYNDVRPFLSEMLKKHFRLYNAAVDWAYFQSLI